MTDGRRAAVGHAVLVDPPQRAPRVGGCQAPGQQTVRSELLPREHVGLCRPRTGETERERGARLAVTVVEKQRGHDTIVRTRTRVRC